MGYSNYRVTHIPHPQEIKKERERRIVLQILTGSMLQIGFQVQVALIGAQ